MLEEYLSTPKNNIPSIPTNTLSPNPQNPTNCYYAGFLIRALAFFLDGFVIVGVLILLGFTYKIILNNLLSINTDLQQTTKETGEIILVVVIYLYFILTTYFWGATLGKKAGGLQVVRKDFTKPSFLQIILREVVGRTLSNLFTIGYFIIPFNKQKRGLHDFLAGTVVIRKSAPDKHETLRIILIFLGIFIVPILLVGLLAAFNPFKSSQESFPDPYPPIRTDQIIIPTASENNISLMITQTLKPLSTYPPTNSWPTYTNPSYSYSIKYPPDAKVEGTETDPFIDIFSENIPDATSWKITVQAEIEKDENAGFADYVNDYIAQSNKSAKDKLYPLAISSETVINDHQAIIVSNDHPDGAKLLLDAYIERNKKSLARVMITSLNGIEKESFRKFFLQIVSTILF